jgi:hypothetical protein
MKFTLKVIATALAAVALAGSAQAASTTNSGNGSLLVYVWDENTQAGYVIDSGLTLSSTLAGGTATLNATGSSLFQSTFSSADIAAGDVLFSVISGSDNIVNPIAITASQSTPSWKPGQTEVAQLDGYEDASIGNLNAGGAGTETLLTSPVPGNGNYQLGLQNVNTATNNGQATTLTASGATAELYEAVSVPNTQSGRNSTPNLPIVTELTDTITVLADGEIEIASAVSPVPLPASAWLFGAGLLGLFGVARRRQSL